MTKLITVSIVTSFVMFLAFPGARAGLSAGTPPPVSQVLVREGDFAVQLSHELRLTTSDDEARAESSLADLGIEPNEGWISDYPVTPVVLDQLEKSTGGAAASGRLSMSDSEAVDALWRAAAAMDLPVRTSDAYPAGGSSSEQAAYEDQSVVNNYYYSSGPPVVSYYSPPPEYQYLYDWTPCAFWYGSFFFPGFFILRDFDVVVHDHFHHFDHDRYFGHDRFDRDHDGAVAHDRFDRDRDHDFRHITNHKFDNDGRSYRINATTLGSVRMNTGRQGPAMGGPTGFNARNMNSARSIFNGDSGRFAAFSHSRGGDTNTGDLRSPGFTGNVNRTVPGDRSFKADQPSIMRSFTGNGAVEGRSGGIGFSSGSRFGTLSSGPESSGMPRFSGWNSGHEFSRGFGSVGGFSAGGFSHGGGGHGGHR